MKIFIIYASAGAGHRKAAEALISSYTKQLNANVQVRKIDALEYTNRLFKWAYPVVYIFLVGYAPFLWGTVFHFLNSRPLIPLIAKIRLFFNRLNGPALIKFICKEKPDIVICVHFFAAQLIADLRQRGEFNGKLICVVTDFGVHQFWINPGTDYYIVASDVTKKELLRKKVEDQRIKVFGIPISELFTTSISPQTTRSKLSLSEEKFTILVTSGGFGIGPVHSIVNQLDETDTELQIIVICGKNNKLVKNLKKLKFRKQVKILGYVNNMHEVMSAANLMITKSGGLTVSESLARSLPMIIIRPIPGQETKNADVITSYEAGIQIRKISEINKQIENLLKNDMYRLLQMKENAQRLARPMAAYNICQWTITKLLQVS